MKSQPVLSPIGLAQLDSGDLGDGVRLVGWFEPTGQQLRLVHRLRALAWINARAAQIQKSPHVKQMRRVHHRGVNHHVVVQELGGARGVGQDATDRARDQKHVLRAVRPEPVIHRGLVPEIQLFPGCRQLIVEPTRAESTEDCGAHQTPVARHEDPRVLRKCHGCTSRNALMLPTWFLSPPERRRLIPRTPAHSRALFLLVRGGES